MKDYTMKVNETKEVAKEELKLPPVPFVVKISNTYIVGKNNHDHKYSLTSLETGRVYSYSDYTEEDIIKYIKNGSWKLIESEINLVTKG